MRAEDCTVSFYRYLYDTVGEPWLWFERRLDRRRGAGGADRTSRRSRSLSCTCAACPPASSSSTPRRRARRSCAISGSSPTLSGAGSAPTCCRRRSIRPGRDRIDRFWLHTSTFDHPKALGIYQRAGFVVYARRRVSFDDPRDLGILPKDGTELAPWTSGSPKSRSCCARRARRFLENECGTQFVRQRMAEPAAVTDEFWQKLAEQGWLGIVYPEDEGGSGLGLVDLVVLMEEMGRAVMPGPFLSTVLLGGAAIAEAGSPAQRRRWLPRIAAGNAKAALAWTEPNLRWDAAGIMLSGARGRGRICPLRHQALRRRCASGRHSRRRGAHPRRQHDGGRRQPVPRAEGHAGLADHACCRRSTRPANCARSGSTMSRCRRAHCSAKYIRVGRRCRG